MSRFILIDNYLNQLSIDDDIGNTNYAIVDTLYNDTWYVEKRITFKYIELFEYCNQANIKKIFNNDKWCIPNIEHLIKLGDYNANEFVPSKIFGDIFKFCQVASKGNLYSTKEINLLNGNIYSLNDNFNYVGMLLCPNYNPLRV